MIHLMAGLPTVRIHTQHYLRKLTKMLWWEPSASFEVLHFLWVFLAFFSSSLFPVRTALDSFPEVLMQPKLILRVLTPIAT